jgi:hypothetical protein
MCYGVRLMPPPELAAYFAAEKQGGILLVCLGLASLALAAFLWFNKSSFAAMAWPLVAAGIFELVIGVTVAGRTTSQIAALERDMQASPRSALAAELHRMERVNAAFRVIKVAEVVFIVASLCLVLFFPQPSAWSAVGLGLLVQAALLLAFDVFAHQRALVYTNWLRGLSISAS